MNDTRKASSIAENRGLEFTVETAADIFIEPGIKCFQKLYSIERRNMLSFYSIEEAL